MESSISLSDKVVSQCKLSNASVMLLDTPIGLCFKWLLSENDGSSKKICSTPVNSVKTLGWLYPVLLTSELELVIFGRKIKSYEDHSKSCTSCIIVCYTGVVMAAHQKLVGTLSLLCHLKEPIVWAGVVQDDGDNHAIAIVSRVGTIHIGLPSKKALNTRNRSFSKLLTSSLVWQKETLKRCPLVCCCYSNYLFLSDGISSWLSIFKFQTKDKVNVRCHMLPYCGVIKITSVDYTELELLTSDGRTYNCRWNELIGLIKSDKSVSKPMEKEPSCSVKEVMTGIQRCSEMVQVEGKKLCDLDIYMNQLSLATSLLVESHKDVFVATVKLENRFEQKGSYIGLLNLKNSTQVQLEGKWWKLNISFPESDSQESICIKLNEQDLNKDLNICLMLPYLNHLHSLSCVKITCHLILCHYITYEPVCQILACQSILNIFHFLTHRHVLKNASLSSINFTSALQNFALTKQVNCSIQVANCAPVPPCHVRLSFFANEINRQLFLVLVHLNASTGHDVDTKVSTNQLQVWLNDIPVDLNYRKLDEKMVVSIYGPNPSLVLSSKGAIEREIIQNGMVPAVVNLPADVFEQAQRTSQILEFESSKPTTQTALCHLHQMVIKMLCSIPL